MAALINIALDLLLILVMQMGVLGAALATIISQLASGIGCLIVMKRRFPILHLSGDDLRFRPLFARRLINMGVPMGLQYSITAIGSVVIQTAINGLGTAAVAASSKLSCFFACVFDALATTMATFAGQNIGARKLHRVHEGLKASALIGIIYCIVAAVVVWLFGRNLIGLFVDAPDVDVISMAYQFLLINSLFYIPLLFVNIVRFSIQGMGYTRIAMFAGVAEMIARALVATCLVPFFGFNAACLSNPAAWVFADLFLIPCYFHVVKRLSLQLGVSLKGEAHAA